MTCDRMVFTGKGAEDRLIIQGQYLKLVREGIQRTEQAGTIGDHGVCTSSASDQTSPGSWPREPGD